MNNKIAQKIESIKPLDEAAMKSAQEKQNNLTKPQGSLGRLEDLSIQLAGIYSQVDYQIDKKTIIVMAADHGIVEEGVSLYPQEVTAQMVNNFLAGGAGINVLSKQVGAEVKIVDIGIKSNIEQAGLIVKKIKSGTNNFRRGPAMNQDEAEQAINAGLEISEQVIQSGTKLIGTGEMGIGNTTPSTAILSVFSGISPGQITGRGTGLEDNQIKTKSEIITQAIELNKPDRDKPLDVLAKVGGLEIAGLTGVIIGGAANRIPVVIDGFISGAAALVALHLCPLVKDYMIASHRSNEKGHSSMLEVLRLKPLIDLDMRLGEGTGAALAMNLIEAATRILNEMATFDSAQVSRKEI